MAGPQLDRFKAALAGRYRVEREIGSGGMAIVYLAEDLKHRRHVAIKVLKPELAAALGPERFLREIQVAARLTHPHILPLHDSGEAAGFLYYVMPAVEGESLRQRLDREPRPSVEEAIGVATAVASALDFAHRCGVIHRDIKPENILLQQGEPMVADFGIALALNAAGGERLTESGVSLGTPNYMSPEQATGERAIDRRSDIYSLGCVLYEMLTGRLPTEGNTLGEVLTAKALGRFTPVRDLRPDLPGRLRSAVERALAPAPEGRFATAGELGVEIGRVIPELADIVRRRLRRRVAAIAAGVMLVAAIVAAKFYADRAREHWARTTALTEMRRLIGANQWDSLHALAIRVASVIPNDSGFLSLWRTFSFPASIRTDPPGARVFRRPYDDADTSSLFLGTTPLDSLRLPWFASRLRLELPGYRTQELVAFSWMLGIMVGGSGFRPGVTIALDPVDSAPVRMVRVTGFALPQWWLHLPEAMEVGDSWLDRYEVTNRQYREFVDAGGYRNREYWRERLELNGREVPWEEAMRRFVDRTGQPGPSTWQASSYPDGQDEYPVSGVSWYEAAAYARFAGKELPTYWHWRQGLSVETLYLVLPRSNIARTEGPAPVGSYGGLGAFGTYDQAGNVREWVYSARDGQRLIMGGAWSDADWLTLNLITASPWDRSAINGFRLARYLEETPALGKARDPIPDEPGARDYVAEPPAPPREVRIYRRLHDYDRLPLEPRLERSDTARDWIRERVSFTAAYGAPRMAAYLYLPRRGQPPYQAVIYWPGSMVLDYRDIGELPEAFHSFFVTAGRAVILPLYLGTFDRDDGHFSLTQASLPPWEGSRWRDLTIQWVRDLRRSIDYLATRADVDTTRVAYFGHSWGAWEAPVALAVEPRIKAGITFVGGLWDVRFAAEIDPFNFLGAVRVPFLMLGSRYDPIFPLETSQRPMFERLGTPPQAKTLFVYDGGSHYMPLDIVARESLAWLDRHLGPVRSAPQRGSDVP